MSTGRFSSEALNVLTASGWEDGRQISSELLRKYEAAGGQSHEPARTFLREFGGLEIEFQNKLAMRSIETGTRDLQQLPGGVIPTEVVRFDPVDTIATFGGTTTLLCSRLMDKTMVTLGWSPTSQHVCLLDEDGCGYLATSSTLSRIANCPDEFLTNLVEFSDCIDCGDPGRGIRRL